MAPICDGHISIGESANALQEEFDAGRPGEKRRRDVIGPTTPAGAIDPCGKEALS
jgi:hypothetical protein